MEHSNIKVLEDWPWTHPSYSFGINVPVEKIKSIKIDPDEGMADADLSNNSWGEE